MGTGARVVLTTILYLIQHGRSVAKSEFMKQSDLCHNIKISIQELKVSYYRTTSLGKSFKSDWFSKDEFSLYFVDLYRCNETGSNRISDHTDS